MFNKDPVKKISRIRETLHISRVLIVALIQTKIDSLVQKLLGYKVTMIKVTKLPS